MGEHFVKLSYSYLELLSPKSVLYFTEQDNGSVYHSFNNICKVKFCIINFIIEKEEKVKSSNVDS